MVNSPAHCAYPHLLAERVPLCPRPQALLTAMKEQGLEELPDDQAVAVLRKLAKMRKESIEMYEKGNALERVAEEQKELEIIDAYLPQLASAEQTRVWIEEIIAGGAADVGKVMAALMKQHKDELDGKLAQQLVREVLNG